MKDSKIIKVCVFLMILVIFYRLSQIGEGDLVKRNSIIDSLKAHGILPNNSKVISVEYNYPPSLSGKTREEIYNIRKKYVSNSIFSNKKYNPSQAVFGQIVDNKPWVALDACYNGKTKSTRTDGPSEEGRFIANPTILVAIEYPFLLGDSDSTICKLPVNNLIPDSVFYDDTKKEITVRYTKLPINTTDRSYYQFNGINARDLGYQYMFVDNGYSSFKLKFINPNQNASTKVVELKNFIHLGNSCGVQGGCNNGAPRQKELEFGYRRSHNQKRNSEIIIKLWKTKPYSPEDKADIIEKIVIMD